MQKTERTEAIIDGDHDHLSLLCELSPVIERFTAGAEIKSAPMNPHHNRQIPIRLFRCVHI